MTKCEECEWLKKTCDKEGIGLDEGELEECDLFEPKQQQEHWLTKTVPASEVNVSQREQQQEEKDVNQICERCNRVNHTDKYWSSVYGFCDRCHKLFIPLLRELRTGFIEGTFVEHIKEHHDKQQPQKQLDVDDIDGFLIHLINELNNLEIVAGFEKRRANEIREKLEGENDA